MANLPRRSALYRVNVTTCPHAEVRIARLRPALAFAPLGRKRPGASFFAFGRVVIFFYRQALKHIEIVRRVDHEGMTGLVRILLPDIDLILLITSRLAIRFLLILRPFSSSRGPSLPALAVPPRFLHP